MAVALTPAEMFWAKVDPDPDTGCLIWTGARVGRVGQKYGQTRWGNGFAPAHRAAWELERGPIPEGLVLDHLCRNTVCVNPEHLRVTTQRDNILAGTGVAARFAARTHCNYGHSLSDAYPRGHGGRICRTCSRETYLRAKTGRMAA